MPRHNTYHTEIPDYQASGEGGVSPLGRIDEDDYLLVGRQEALHRIEFMRIPPDVAAASGLDRAINSSKDQ